MMEDLASAISRRRRRFGAGGALGGFPTSGLAVIRFADGLARPRPGRGYLEAFLTPGDRCTRGRHSATLAHLTDEALLALDTLAGPGGVRCFRLRCGSA